MYGIGYIAHKIKFRCRDRCRKYDFVILRKIYRRYSGDHAGKDQHGKDEYPSHLKYFEAQNNT
jgi:hypothetical protein